MRVRHPSCRGLMPVRDEHVPWQVRSRDMRGAASSHDDFYGAHQLRNEGSLIRRRRWTQTVMRWQRNRSRRRGEHDDTWHADFLQRDHSRWCVPLLIIRFHVMRHPLKMPTQMRKCFDPLGRRRKCFPREFVMTMAYNDYVNRILLEFLMYPFVNSFRLDAQCPIGQLNKMFVFFYK